MAEAPFPPWLGPWQALARQAAEGWQDWPGPARQAASPAPGSAEAWQAWANLFTPPGIPASRPAAGDASQAWQAMLAALLGGQRPPAAAPSTSPATPWAAFAALMPEMPQAAGAWATPPAWPGPATASLPQWPAFGPAREHIERQQAAFSHWQEYQQAMQRYQQLVADAMQEGFRRFQLRLADGARGGKPVESPRQLYDLWVDATEDAWAERALGEEFGKAYAELANAQMRVRADVQDFASRLAAEVGLPTRAEVDTLGQRLQEVRRALKAHRDGGADRSLTREVAALARQVAALQGALAHRAAPAADAPEPAPPGDRAAPGASAARKAALKKTAGKAAAGAAAKTPAAAVKAPRKTPAKAAGTPAKAAPARAAVKKAGAFAERLEAFTDASRRAPRKAALQAPARSTRRRDDEERT